PEKRLVHARALPQRGTHRTPWILSTKWRRPDRGGSRYSRARAAGDCWMSVFGGQYAANYDLFYAHKDYPAEAAFIKDVLHRHNPTANSMVEFGCGSARHAVEFVRSGFRVTGIDRSAEMIALGQERRKSLPPRLQENLNLMQGDAVGFRPTLNTDAVVSLFHVVSYQTSNEALLGIFDSARTTLIPGGLFVFDFWHGPAVLTERPQVRIKRITTSSHNL